MAEPAYLPSETLDWGKVPEMTAFEATMWRAEADPRLRSTTTLVETLDRVPDWERLRAGLERNTRLVPRLRELVVEPALPLGPPNWIVDPNFDVSYHLRRVRLPAPGTFRQLLEVAEWFTMSPLDLARPPWEAMLVDGLPDGTAAFIFKFHHSLTDGHGVVQLHDLLTSRTPESRYDREVPAPPESEELSSRGLLVRQTTSLLRGVPGATVRLGLGSLRNAGRALRNPVRSADDAVHFARSLQRVLAPPPVDRSPLLRRGTSLAVRFVAYDVPLAELKAAAKAVGGSLNDAFVAGLLGALRIYHEHFDEVVEEIPIGIPISLRTGEHPMGGNRFAGARLAAPLAEPDPAERIQRIHELVLTLRQEPAITALDALGPLLYRLPSALLAELTANFAGIIDMQASNVPGLPYSAYIAGARITRVYGFGPRPGTAAMVGLVSHEGVCCIGINLDPASVTDVDLFERCLHEGFDEVLSLGPNRRRRDRGSTVQTEPEGAPPMTSSTDWEFQGARGRVVAREWDNPDATHIVLLSHGGGEHIGRYEHVADRLVRNGAVVLGPDHLGHGKSEGERMLIEEFEDTVDDLHRVAERARERHPNLPLVLVGHSMGSIIAVRYAQRYPEELTALVVSGAGIGRVPAAVAGLLDLPEIPDVPLDPAMLSRDPEVGRAYAEDPLVHHGGFQRSFLEALLRILDEINNGPKLGSLPTLWLHGEQDQITQIEDAQVGFDALQPENFERHVYPGAKHEVYNEINRNEVLNDLVSFINRVLAERIVSAS
jgi:WS/DGAT/MGAT family acyltransferase